MKGSAPPGDRLLVVLLSVLIITVPTVFLRSTFTTFDVPQLTLFWVLSVALILVGAHRVAASGVVERGPSALTAASTAFLAAVILTSVLASQPWVAFTGLGVRGAGAVSYGLCLGLLHVVYRVGLRRSLRPLVFAFVGAHGLIVVYALLQAYGLDPFTWGSGILYVGPVFSTLGNPNFSAGHLGLTMPLVVWLAFGSRLPVALRVLTGAGIGASAVALVHLNSFQGYIASLFGLAVLGQWVWLTGGRKRPIAVAIVSPVAAVLAVVPLALDAPSVGVLAAVMLPLAACTGTAVWWDRREPPGSNIETVPASPRRLWSQAIVLLLGIGAAGALFAGRILDQLTSGLEQRFEFWRTSLSIFATNPIVGTGLETYRTYFTSHRPLSHAQDHEFVLSDSPHSVPLSLLGGGGLVLFLAYGALVLLILYYGVRAVRRAVGPERLLFGAVLAAWSAYHVQSLVSIDIPSLMHTQWVLGGILLAGGVAGETPRVVLARGEGTGRDPTPRHGEVRWRTWGAASVVLVVLVLLLGPLTAPLRADLAAYRAQQAMDETDYQTAGEELLRAIDLQPRNWLYADGMALVYGESGLHEWAFDERVRSARLQPGNPYAAFTAARIAVRLGNTDAAGYWYERAVEYEPRGAEVLSEAAAFFAENSRGATARELLHSFKLLGSHNRLAWLTVMEAYLILDDQKDAQHAWLCHAEGRLPAADGDWGHLAGGEIIVAVFGSVKALAERAEEFVEAGELGCWESY